MARADKLLEAMRRNPAGDWTIGDFETLSRRYGLVFEAPRRGSHFTVKMPAGAGFVSVPSRRPIKPVYVREMVRLVDDMLGRRDDGE